MIFSKVIGFCAVAGFVGEAQGLKLNAKSWRRPTVGRRQQIHDGTILQLGLGADKRMQVISRIVESMDDFLRNQAFALGISKSGAKLTVESFRKQNRITFLAFRTRLGTKLKTEFDQAFESVKYETVESKLEQLNTPSGKQMLREALSSNNLSLQQLQRLHGVMKNARLGNRFSKGLVVGLAVVALGFVKRLEKGRMFP